MIVRKCADDSSWEILPTSVNENNVTLKELPSNKISSIVDRAILLACLLMTLLPLLCAFSIAFYARKRMRNRTFQGLS